MPEPSETGVWPVAAVAPAERPAMPGYELLGELGRGGMGVVYKARQIGSDRLVALKLIRDGALAGPQERARFRVEAAAAARVRHPNVVEVFEIGEHNGLPYFAMELVEGGSLDQYLAGKPLPPTHAAELTRTLALAVQHAHSLQIIHRDLKPANILLGVASGQGLMVSKSVTTGDWPLTTFAKIADFGLAKRLDTENTALTRDGTVLGTLGYMAPEQAAGRIKDIGPAVDVYAIGAMLYEMLTGRPPFVADSREQTIEQVLHDEPAPPTRVFTSVPCDLETVCLKCLEKEPGKRYATAGELAADLGRYLAGSPVIAVPIGELERLTREAAQDGYKVFHEIGRGPRSVVYRASQGPLEQPVALKVFHSGICTRDEWDARLRRGAEVRAGLSHPNFVSVRGAGWWDGRPYVAVEFVPQGQLNVKPEGKLLPIRQVLQLIEQVGEVVGYLHRQGMVHGNLKPSNVLLAADGIPRVVDLHSFGGAFFGDRTERAGLAYVAPELLNDPTLAPRQNTDVYGLGLILYELLTGRPTFQADTAAEMLEEVCRRDPVPPSEFNSNVSEALDAVSLRCLRRNPWRRYMRVFDLVKRLKELQKDAGDR